MLSSSRIRSVRGALLLTAILAVGASATDMLLGLLMQIGGSGDEFRLKHSGIIHALTALLFVPRICDVPPSGAAMRRSPGEDMWMFTGRLLVFLAVFSSVTGLCYFWHDMAALPRVLIGPAAACAILLLAKAIDTTLQRFA